VVLAEQRMQLRHLAVHIWERAVVAVVAYIPSQGEVVPQGIRALVVRVGMQAVLMEFLALAAEVVGAGQQY
jgi:hypothetical protein